MEDVRAEEERVARLDVPAARQRVRDERNAREDPGRGVEPHRLGEHELGARLSLAGADRFQEIRLDLRMTCETIPGPRQRLAQGLVSRARERQDLVPDAGVAQAGAVRMTHLEEPVDEARLVRRLAGIEPAAAARENGVKLCVAFQNRYNPPIQDLRAVVQAGKLGRLLVGNATVRWYRTQEYYEDGWHGTWAMDGGAMMKRMRAAPQPRDQLAPARLTEAPWQRPGAPHRRSSHGCRSTPEVPVAPSGS